MKTRDWLTDPGANVPRYLNHRVGPGHMPIDPPFPPNSPEWCEDLAFETLVQTCAEQRYPMLHAWARQEKSYASQFMASILAMPRDATAKAMESQRALWEERKYRP
jgi:hypothetical protein